MTTNDISTPITDVIATLDRLAKELAGHPAILRLEKAVADLRDIEKAYSGTPVPPPAVIADPDINFRQPIVEQLEMGGDMPDTVATDNQVPEMVDQVARPANLGETEILDPMLIPPMSTSFTTGEWPGPRVPAPNFTGVPLPILDVPASGLPDVPASIGKSELPFGRDPVTF